MVVVCFIGVMLFFLVLKSGLVYVANVMLGQSSFYCVKMYLWKYKLVGYEHTNDNNRFNVGY